MYSSCLYCSAALGQNDVIEAFPVGRRLAFDAGKGRLWVVCARCHRWCLSPIDERWEAIEACEQAFRDARLRVSSDEIGLVRLREGLELVRIGAPLRPEMAAWRYGREYAQRRRKAVVVAAGAAGLAATGATAAISGGAASAWVGMIALGVLPVIHLTGLLGFAAYAAVDSAAAIRLRHDGKDLRVYRADLSETHLVPTTTGAQWGLRLKHSYGRLVLTGADAERITSRLLARVNGAGASRWLVRDATTRLLDTPDLNTFLRQTAVYSGSLADEHAVRKQEFLRALERNAFTAGKFDETRNPGSLSRLAPPTCLALEMALHEESDRAAMEGELAPLLSAWREAEVIAGIADTLLVPPGVESRLDAMRTDRNSASRGEH